MIIFGRYQLLAKYFPELTTFFHDYMRSKRLTWPSVKCKQWMKS